MNEMEIEDDLFTPIDDSNNSIMNNNNNNNNNNTINQTSNPTANFGGSVDFGLNYVTNKTESLIEKYYKVDDKSDKIVKYNVEGNDFEVPERYKLKYAIGKGGYGIVCSAFDSAEKENVAIKKIYNIFDHDTEFQKRILREIKILRHLNHENVINLYDLIPPHSFEDFKDVYIVSELMETDLRQIIKSKQQLSYKHIQYFLYQILSGTKYIHKANVLHRDLKPGNILLNSNCDLKICDFGLSRGFDFENGNPVLSTPYVATRWYRSPELLLMWDQATKAIDVWSIGCIFIEMLSRKPIFPGENYLRQLEFIIKVLGTPKNIDVYGCQKAKKYLSKQKKYPKKSFKSIFPNIPDDAIDLLEKMLEFNPKKRITIDEALKHKFFNGLDIESDESQYDVSNFNFDFEKQKLDKPTLKKLIYEEIVSFQEQKYESESDAESDEEMYDQN